MNSIMSFCGPRRKDSEPRFLDEINELVAAREAREQAKAARKVGRATQGSFTSLHLTDAQKTLLSPNF